MRQCHCLSSSAKSASPGFRKRGDVTQSGSSPGRELVSLADVPARRPALRFTSGQRQRGAS
jgi:hypothetical protein